MIPSEAGPPFSMLNLIPKSCNHETNEKGKKKQVLLKFTEQHLINQREVRVYVSILKNCVFLIRILKVVYF
jgi:hypothetical protein